MARFASGRVEWDMLFRSIWHNVPNVPEKDKNVPRCRRRNPPLSEATGPFERAPRHSCYLQDVYDCPYQRMRFASDRAWYCRLRRRLGL